MKTPEEFAQYYYHLPHSGISEVSIKSLTGCLERYSKHIHRELPPPDCHFQDESGKWVWAYSKELIDKTFK